MSRTVGSIPRPLLLVPLAVACAGADVKLGETDDPTGSDPDDSGTIDTDTHETDTTDTSACGVDPALSLLSVTPDDVSGLALARHVDVALSTAAELGIACTRAEDPDEVLYWQRPAATDHAVDLFGLAPSSTYTCRVAPTCPRTAGGPETFEITTSGGPSGLPEMDVESNTTLTPSQPSTLLINTGPCNGNGSSYLVMYDLAGTPRWYYELDPDLWTDVVADYLGGGRVSWGGGFHQTGVPHIIGLDGEDIDQARWPGSGTDTYTHEGHVLPDGRFLSFAWVENEDERSTWNGYEVFVSDPETDTLDWSWSSQVGVDAGLFPSGRNDVYHGNWAEVITHEDGTERLYTSMCYSDWIVSIDVESTDILWRLGRGGDLDLVDTDGDPLGDEWFTDCQHGIEIVGNRVLAYDNGMSRSYSRVVEYDVDEAAMTATLTWSWTEDGWATEWLGDADYLAGGHVLLTEGQQDCAWQGGEDVRNKVVEVDRESGEVVWRGTFEDDTLTYRSQRVDVCDAMPDVRTCPDAATAWEAARDVFE